MWSVRIMKNIDAHRGPIVTMTINHRLMYTGSADGTAKCWVTEFGDNTQVYRGHGMSVTAVKFYKGLGEKEYNSFFSRSYKNWGVSS